MRALRLWPAITLLVASGVTSDLDILEAAQVTKINRADSSIVLRLNRREYRSLKGEERVTVQDSRSRRNLDGMVMRIRPGQALIRISRKDRIPSSLRSRSSVRVSPVRSRTSMSLAARRSPDTTMTSTNRSNVMSYKPGGSETDRIGKSVSFDTEVGTAVAPIPTAGATLGFYITRNVAFELNYARGTQILENQDIFDGLVEVQPTVIADVVSTRFKTFLSNSFYINSGLGLRSLNVVANPTELDESFEVISSGPVFTKRRVDATFDFAIGNKWQISYFNIGVDWLGLQAPLSKVRLPDDGLSIALDTGSGSGPETFLQETGDPLSDLEKFDQNRGTTFSSRFYIGFSF